jgi:phosphotransferase system IIB component
MIKILDNYTYKFINRKHVYCISDCKTKTFSTTKYYSIPHVSKETGLINNALIGFANIKQCTGCVRELRKDFSSSEIIPIKVKLEDLKYMGSVMNLPVVVIIDEALGYDLARTYEIYYHYKGKPDKDFLRSNCE